MINFCLLAPPYTIIFARFPVSLIAHIFASLSNHISSSISSTIFHHIGCHHISDQPIHNEEKPAFQGIVDESITFDITIFVSTANSRFIIASIFILPANLCHLRIFCMTGLPRVSFEDSNLRFTA
jgi:hypothetical protein